MGVECNDSFHNRTAGGIKGRWGRREAEPAQSCSRLGEKGWRQRRLVTPRARRGGKVLGWVAASLPFPASSISICPESWSSSGGQASGEEDAKDPGILTHHLLPLSRARSKSQDFGPGHCGRGRGDSIWGTPALPRATPPPLPVSEAARERRVEPESALSCRCWGSGAPFQNYPPGSSLNAGPVVASEETGLGPDFQRLASLSDAQRPHRGEKALYFPAGHGVAGHPGTCSLRWSKEPVGGRELKHPRTDFGESAGLFGNPGLGVNGIMKGGKKRNSEMRKI